MNTTGASGDVPSPCVNICELNHYSICTGCGRTAREIERWVGASRELRREIREAAALRLQNMTPGKSGRTHAT
jgi:predicted Fe-S protein YdhL (DUF1289 family)